MNKNFNIIILSLLSGATGAVLVLVLLPGLLAQGMPGAYMMNMLGRVDRTAPNVSARADEIAGLSDAANSEPGPAPVMMDNREEQIIQTVQAANRAVVSVIISKDVPIIERYYEEPSDDPFGDFFPFRFQIPQYRQKGTEKRQIGGGSGFLVSQDGFIITNKHVVSQEGAEYTVFFNDGTRHEAEIIARDPGSDIAVLKIKGDKFAYLNFADSNAAQVGQTVIAIGNALAEFRNTVSVGVISGLSRSITAGNGFGQSELLEGVIQTDAAINPGNSGGPLLTLDGRVIGVNVAIAQGSENIGFALPSNAVKTVVDSVKKTGKIVRPFLGVRYMLINAQIKEKNKLSVDYGALVIRGQTDDELAVTPGSPADKAGIVENDIILSVDGVKITEERSLAGIIRQKKVGDVITLNILSKGQERSVSVTLQELTT